MTVNSKTFKTNLIFWTCYFLYEWLANSAYDNAYGAHLLAASLFTPLIILATIFTIYFLLRYYFNGGEKWKFWVGLIASMLVFGVLRRTINYFLIYPMIWPDSRNAPYILPVKILFEIVNTYLIVALNAMFYFTQAWYEQQRLAQSLQKDKAEAQLELLKSQVQPHFIFNTLNNIYSLSTQNNSKTPDLIFRLSSLLSYMLYDSKQDTIPLTKEIEYISNYIELEKIRYGERLDVSMNILMDPDHIRIAPFLMLPLVENSFKHGASHSIEHCWIRIDVLAREGALIIKVENSIPINGCIQHAKSGIGTDNLRKRLEYIYPRKHEFRCIAEEQSFLATLKIKDVVHENKVPVSG
ncbi:MAG: histidine kinase [Candidatus Pseudobacter hemicellulosilyticus]|uniref:Histidine kinase n=1 Tax=Candidatus Pseudobacter hemicellulosilyticus TaxID=3121375 RepID=A0AAJ6BJB5_9BACT|nr:MAG: histidine kinase [Pseudobacter sp.]